MATGIKISKEGINVKEAKETDLIINSEIDSPKVYLSGVDTVSGQGATQEHTVITHDLGYAPAYLVFLNLGTDNDPKWYVNEVLGVPAPTPGFFVYSKDTTLEVWMSSGTPGQKWKFHYFIFYEEL